MRIVAVCIVAGALVVFAAVVTPLPLLLALAHVLDQEERACTRGWVGQVGSGVIPLGKDMQPNHRSGAGGGAVASSPREQRRRGRGGREDADVPAAADARKPHAPDTVYCPRNSAWCCCCISSSVPRQRWLARSTEEVCHSAQPHAPSSTHAAKNDPTERMRTLRWSSHGENSRLCGASARRQG